MPSTSRRAELNPPRRTPDPRPDPDAELHRIAAPRHCPDCAAPVFERGLVVEYWRAEQTVYHCWCSACGFAGDIVRINRYVGYETEH
jgi:hypothetical protein